MDMQVEQRLGAINGINHFKDEIKAVITSQTGWGKNQLAEVIEEIEAEKSKRINLYEGLAKSYKEMLGGLFRDKETEYPDW